MYLNCERTGESWRESAGAQDMQRLKWHLEKDLVRSLCSNAVKPIAFCE